jgi:hypothetical protein
MKLPFRVSKTWNLGVFKEKQPFDIVHGAKPREPRYLLYQEESSGQDINMLPPTQIPSCFKMMANFFYLPKRNQ